MKGKTAREVADAAERFRQAATAPLAQQQPVQPQYQPQQVPQMPDFQLAYSDPPEYARRKAAYDEFMFDSRLQQQAAPFVTGLAQNARALSQMDPKWADVWKKYGHEIDLQANQLPPQMRSKDAYDLIAKVIKADHVEELLTAAREEERSKYMTGTGTVSPGAVANGAVPLGDDLGAFLSSDHPEAAKYRDIPRDQLVKYIRDAGITAKQWVEDVSKGRSFNG